MSQIQTGIGIADVTLSPRSKETGFTNTPFVFTASASTVTRTFWESIESIGQLSGSVVIFGNVIGVTTRIAINGLNTTQIFDNQTFSMSSDPLNSITVIIKTNTVNTELSVALSAVKYEF